MLPFIYFNVGLNIRRTFRVIQEYLYEGVGMRHIVCTSLALCNISFKNTFLKWQLLYTMSSETCWSQRTSVAIIYTYDDGLYSLFSIVFHSLIYIIHINNKVNIKTLNLLKEKNKVKSKCGHSHLLFLSTSYKYRRNWLNILIISIHTIIHA